MRYVGKGWKNSGILLLFGLSVYVSLFIGNAWSKKLRSGYISSFRPALVELPSLSYKEASMNFDFFNHWILEAQKEYTEVQKLQAKKIPTLAYQDKRFVFKAEMPLKIHHPVTKEPIIYIDTRTSSLNKESEKFPCTISQDKLTILPAVDLTHEQFYTLLNKEELTNFSIITRFDTIFQNITPLCILAASFWVFVSELLKILMISALILFIFKRHKEKKSFKQITRLAILTYIPLVIINGIYSTFMSTPGMFSTMLYTFMHIVLLMKAIAINDLSDKEYEDSKKLSE